MTERPQWVLWQLRRAVRLQRAMREHKFVVGDKTTKRNLADLTSRVAVEFVREGREGHYRPPSSS